MLDLSQFGTVGGLAVAVGLIMQLLKATILPPNLKPFIPWMAIGGGVILALLYGVAFNQSGSAALAQLALTGLSGGLTATGGYQALVDAFKPRPAAP